MDQNKLEQNINDLIETVGYIKDNMATKQELAAVSDRVDDLEIEIDNLKNYTRGMETRLVTKSYLDDKLADWGAKISEQINRWLERDKNQTTGAI